MASNWQRIEKVVRWTGLSVNSFALSIGLSRGENLYQIKRGNHGISRELASTIAAKYPKISRAWLLTGEGDMFVSNALARLVPFFDTDIEKYVSSPECFEASCLIALPAAEAGDFGAYYRGRAMEGEIPAGSIVVARLVPLSALIPGGDYVVVTDRTAMIRRVRREVGSDFLRLQPADTDNFDEIQVDAGDVRGLYLVVSIVINKIL